MLVSCLYCTVSLGSTILNLRTTAYTHKYISHVPRNTSKVHVITLPLLTLRTLFLMHIVHVHIIIHVHVHTRVPHSLCMHGKIHVRMCVFSFCIIYVCTCKCFLLICRELCLVCYNICILLFLYRILRFFTVYIQDFRCGLTGLTLLRYVVRMFVKLSFPFATYIHACIIYIHYQRLSISMYVYSDGGG